MTGSRREITEILTRAVTLYLVDRRYSVHHEIGVKTRRRLDILSLNYKGHIIGIEVKSCIDDYRSDQKWRTYLPYVNKLYFCFPAEMWDKHKERLKTEIGSDAGVMVVETLANGFIRAKVVKAVAERELDKNILLQNCIKMAWRGGESCAQYAKRAAKRMHASDPMAEPRKKRGYKHRSIGKSLPTRIMWKGIKR